MKKGSFVICLVAVLFLVNTAYAVDYTYNIFPTYGNYQSNAISDINNNGDIVGWVAGNSRGFLYSNGEYTELLPKDGLYAEAYGINDYGKVVGSTVIVRNGGSSFKAFTYEGGSYTEIQPYSQTWGSAINNDGLVAGRSSNGYGFIYDNGSVTEVLPTGWKAVDIVRDINDSGVVIGDGHATSNDYRGFIYDNGTYTDIEYSGANDTLLFDINNSGSLIGSGTYFSSPNKGFLYFEGSYIDILPPGWSEAEPVAINNNGTIVGNGCTGCWGIGGVFIYQNGVYTDLLTPDGLANIEVAAINDLGVIAGRGWTSTGDVMNFTATPTVIPEPISSILFITGGATLGLRRYTRKRK